MKIALAAFRGELPIVDPRLLPEQNATSSRNLTLKHGTLKPQNALGTVAGLPLMVSPSSLFLYPEGNNGKGFWFAWGNNKIVHAVKSPLADDDWHRVYWTGDGAPKMGDLSMVTQGSGPYPSASLRLGVPSPNGGTFVSTPNDRVGSDQYPLTAVQAVYVTTLVSRFGEEGPPSDPSDPVLRWDMVSNAPAGGGVQVNLPNLPAGAHNITTKRLYRAEAGTYMLVAELPAAIASYFDVVPSSSLSVALESLEWDMPDDRMVGLTSLPGGFLAGHFENTLCFSESYRPHAWPVSYQLAFSDDIMGVVSTTAGLVVATRGRPHLVTGSSPAAMADMVLDVDQPCVSRRSLVDMGDFAIYASHSGLVAVGGREAEVITAQAMSREQWQALNPASIHAYRYDGRYIAFYLVGGIYGAFAFTPADGFEFYDLMASGGYYDLLNDRLCMISERVVKAWGAGLPMSMIWRSKTFEFPPGGSFTCAKVIARSYPVEFRLLAEGEVVALMQIEDRQLFRLPAGYAHVREWAVEVRGTNEVFSVQVATSPSELM